LDALAGPAEATPEQDRPDRCRKDVSWTADALTEASLGFAERLHSYNVGERIAFRLPNGPEWLPSFWLCSGPGWRRCLSMAECQRKVAWKRPPPGCTRALSRWQIFSRLGKFQCVIKIAAASRLPRVVVRYRNRRMPRRASTGGWTPGRPDHGNSGRRPQSRGDSARHSYGLGNLVMPLILQGTAMVCAGDYVPRQLVEWIDRYRITVFPAVPALLRIWPRFLPAA